MATRCNCGAVLEDGQRYCTVCGQEQHSQAVGGFCIRCGMKLEPGQAFCTKCGTKVGVVPTQKTSQSQVQPAAQPGGMPQPAPMSQSSAQVASAAKPGNGVTIAIVAIVAIVALVIVGVVVWRFALLPATTNTAPANNTDYVASNTADNTGDGSAASNTKNTNNTNNTNNANKANTTPSAVKEVSVSVVTKSGNTLTGTVRQKSDGFVLSNSSTHLYTESEIRQLGLNAAELSIARNEIYARHGYDFSNSGLQKYFNSCSWYTNSGSKSALGAGSIEEKNAVLLLDIANSSSSTSAWVDLATD